MLDYIAKPFAAEEPFKIDKFYTMFNLIIEPGASYVGESHDFWECSYIRGGRIRHCIDGKVYNTKKGDFVFYKPMEFHQHYVEESEQAEIFCFSFLFKNCPPDFAPDSVYKLNTNQLEIIEKILNFALNAIKNTLFTEEEIALQKSEYINYKHVKALLSLGENTTDMGKIINWIEELFLDLYDTKTVVKEENSFRAGVYKKAVAFMNDNISQKITLPDIAKHCCISETTLKKLFYEFSNLSIHRYLIKLKINQAIMLLRSGVSAYETALRLGFAGQAYFSTAFKRETGLTPREYLKRGE